MPNADTGHEEAFREDIAALKEDLKSLHSDVRGLVSNLVDAGKSTASHAGERIAGAVSEAAEYTREHGRHAAETFEEHVREKPYTSCGIAFAAGVLFSVLLFSRRS